MVKESSTSSTKTTRRKPINNNNKSEGYNEDDAFNNGGNLPKAAEATKAILASMGVHNYQPRVVNQLLELTY
eukprot:Pgem_evm1s14687